VFGFSGALGSGELGLGVVVKVGFSGSVEGVVLCGKGDAEAGLGVIVGAVDAGKGIVGGGMRGDADCIEKP
jgi:hypothetical protein